MQIKKTKTFQLFFFSLHFFFLRATRCKPETAAQLIVQFHSWGRVISPTSDKPEEFGRETVLKTAVQWAEPLATSGSPKIHFRTKLHNKIKACTKKILPVLREEETMFNSTVEQIVRLSYEVHLVNFVVIFAVT